MPQSLIRNYMHIVFSTKERYPFIQPSIAPELYAYLGGICKNMESTSIEIGGYTDHIHVLCLLSRKITLMKLVEELKSHSSKWIKDKGLGYEHFYWQNGYGGFSVNPTEIDVVRQYIANQKGHHEKRTFQDEYRTFLKKYAVEYDEKYVWD